MDAHTDFGILLGLAYLEFTERLNDALRVAGFDDVGASYGYVFRALDQGPLTLSDLAARLEMTTQGAAKIVNAMAASDYVTRRPHPDDARAKELELTDRGRSALAAARRFHHDFEERLASVIGTRQAATLRKVLTAIAGPADSQRSERLLRPM